MNNLKNEALPDFKESVVSQLVEVCLQSKDYLLKELREVIKDEIQAHLDEKNQYRRISRKEAAKLEGISISMLDKIRDRYVSELVGPRKRVFLAKDGLLVRKGQNVEA